MEDNCPDYCQQGKGKQGISRLGVFNWLHCVIVGRALSDTCILIYLLSDPPLKDD
jgi:hypothetical protein